MSNPLQILSYTTLFPNPEAPYHGVFVENRLRHLVGSGRIATRIVAPVPWFPFTHEVFGRYARLARVPAAEVRHEFEVLHPRFPVIPKIGMGWAPGFLYRATLGPVQRILEESPGIAAIDAHYFYPDGVAAARLGRRLGLPVVITARGTDINLIPRDPGPRRQILQAADSAAAIITVCAALKDALVELGVNGSKVRVLRNGVDLEVFAPLADRDAARSRLGMDGPTMLSVGHLIERKGHHLVVDAMRELPGWSLVIAGDGPMRASIEAQILRRDLGERVRLVGRVAHESMRDFYGAADMLVLASSREGWANVLLESMACGTPVAATDIWGTPEVVSEPAAGVLIRERSAAGIALGVRSLAEDRPGREETRRYAEKFSWDETTRGQIEIFHALGNRAETS